MWCYPDTAYLSLKSNHSDQLCGIFFCCLSIANYSCQFLLTFDPVTQIHYDT